MTRSRMVIAACTTVLTIATVTTASAQTSLPAGPSFRMETEIYEDGGNAPVSRHKILFDSGVVYDLTEQGGSTRSVYDPARKRIILLDTKQQLQTEVSTDQLIDVAAQLAVAVRQNDKAEPFGLEATVQVTEDRYSVTFGPCTYETTTQAVSRPEMALAFHEFVVWAKRLDVLHRRGVPPFARMTLGEKVASEGRLPLDLVLTIKEGLKTKTYRAHHLVVEKLSELDRRAIQSIGDQLATYKTVSLEEFPIDG